MGIRVSAFGVMDERRVVGDWRWCGKIETVLCDERQQTYQNFDGARWRLRASITVQNYTNIHVWKDFAFQVACAVIVTDANTHRGPQISIFSVPRYLWVMYLTQENLIHECYSRDLQNRFLLRKRYYVPILLTERLLSKAKCWINKVLKRVPWFYETK